MKPHLWNLALGALHPQLICFELLLLALLTLGSLLFLQRVNVSLFACHVPSTSAHHMGKDRKTKPIMPDPHKGDEASVFEAAHMTQARGPQVEHRERGVIDK